jgi:hypothetical protein
VSPATVHFYIYYRIETAHAAAARSSIEKLMQTANQQFGIRARLLRAQSDATLWMEIYENVADAGRFEAELNAAVDRTAFASWLSPGSTRRIERFVAFESAGESGVCGDVRR